MDPGDSDRVHRALERFAALVSTAYPSPHLDELALALSATLQPQLDGDRWIRALDDLAGQCEPRSREGVMRALFASGRLVGDTVTYRSWTNSCIDRVLASGRGMPISLSVVAVEVARRVGVPLVGVGMPGHFIVGDRDDPDWFADPFGGGRVLDRSGCRALYERVTGDERWSDDFLRATPDLAIVARMVNNLAPAFGRGDRVRQAVVARLRLALPGPQPSSGGLARDLAVLN